MPKASSPSCVPGPVENHPPRVLDKRTAHVCKQGRDNTVGWAKLACQVLRPRMMTPPTNYVHRRCIFMHRLIAASSSNTCLPCSRRMSKTPFSARALTCIMECESVDFWQFTFGNRRNVHSLKIRHPHRILHLKDAQASIVRGPSRASPR